MNKFTKNVASAILILATLFSCISLTSCDMIFPQGNGNDEPSNIIESENIDVELSISDCKYAPETATYRNFANGVVIKGSSVYWEPGTTIGYHVKVSNTGSLAISYVLSITAMNEVSKIADVIDVYIATPATKVETREQVNDFEKLGTLSEVLAGSAIVAKGGLLFAENSTFTVVFKMQESAGNEYQNVYLDADISFKLVASQKTM